MADVGRQQEGRPGAFGRTEASAAVVALERAWAVVRHDRDLIEAGGLVDKADLCDSLCGHLGCASADCRALCDRDAVQEALLHIETLAAGAWLVCDLDAARTTAILAARQVVARPHERDIPALARLSIYRAWRPYVDVIHDLHGRLWGVYGPFWALLARRPRVLAGYRPSREVPTPRDVDAWLASTLPQASGGDDPGGDGSWMEVDEGHCAAALARIRAVALAKRVARTVFYPPAGDTSWAAVRRTLASTLGANPDTRLVLALKHRTWTTADGAEGSLRTVSLYAPRRACPLVADAPCKTVVARVTVVGGAGGAREIKRDRITATVACMQRLCVGKYTLDAWMRSVAKERPDVLYTTALLDAAQAMRSSAPLRLAGGSTPARLVTTTRRSVVLDGCMVAALVRDAYVVQAAVRGASARLFCASPPGSPAVPVDAQAAADADILLARGNVPADRVRAAVRYAAWRVCRGGHRDGCDCMLLASLLNRAGLTTPRSLVGRLAVLWG